MKVFAESLSQQSVCSALFTLLVVLYLVAKKGAGF
jgi:hypothetical protein